MLRFGTAPLFVLVAAVALAQPSPRPLPPLTPAEYAVCYLGNEQLADELKLSPDQRRQLIPVVINGFGNNIQHRFDSNFRAKGMEKTEKDLDAVLTPEQRVRLRQVILQHLARVPTGTETLANDAGVTAKLALTDNQLKKLRGGTPLATVLTPEQAKGWAELTGPAYPHRLVMLGRGVRSAAHPPNELTALNSYPVIAELSLTDAQLEKLDELFWKWADLFPHLSHPNTNLDREYAEFAAAAKALLTAEQRPRFAQLLLQVDVRHLGDRPVFDAPSVAAAVSLTAEQKANLAAVRVARRKEMLALFSSGDPAETIKAKVGEHKAATPAAYTALVTDEQREKLAASLGKPMPAALLARVGGMFSPSMPSPPYDALPPAPKGYLADHTAAHAVLLTRRRPLNFNPEQAKKLAALAAEFKLNQYQFQLPVVPADERPARAAELGKRLGDTLTPEQLATLKKFSLTSPSVSGGLNDTPSRELLALDVTADVLKLTPRQNRLFLSGARLGEVLSPDQRAAWVALVGEPAPVPPAPPFMVIAHVQSFPYSSYAQTQIHLLGDRAVQKDLKLSPEQAKAVSAVLAKVAATRNIPSMQDTPNGHAEWVTRLDAIGRQPVKDATAPLDEAQRNRLGQITLQQCSRATTTGDLTLYAMAEVIESLKLSPEQVKRLAGLVSEYADLYTFLYKETVAAINDGGAHADQYAAQVALMKKYEAKCREVLTADQRAAWKGLFGEPFAGGLPPRK